MPESSLGELNTTANRIRNKVVGNSKNIFWGMKCSIISPEEIIGKYIGLPNDIKKLFYANTNYFDTRCAPMIGRVLLGRYKGLIFSLFGNNDIEKYFNRSHANAVARGERPSHLGCTFRYCAHREAIPSHNKLTKEIINNVKQDKNIID